MGELRSTVLFGCAAIGTRYWYEGKWLDEYGGTEKSVYSRIRYVPSLREGFRLREDALKRCDREKGLQGGVIKETRFSRIRNTQSRYLESLLAAPGRAQNRDPIGNCEKRGTGLRGSELVMMEAEQGSWGSKKRNAFKNEYKLTRRN